MKFCSIHKAQNIQAVGMATFVDNMLGVDLDHIDSAHAYFLPMQIHAAHPNARNLDEQHDLTEVHQRTGCRIHTAYRPARLACGSNARMPELYSDSHNCDHMDRFRYLLLFNVVWSELYPCSYSTCIVVGVC